MTKTGSVMCNPLDGCWDKHKAKSLVTVAHLEGAQICKGPEKKRILCIYAVIVETG